MARTLVFLANNHTGADDKINTLVQTVLECNKKNDYTKLNNEPNDKTTSVKWDYKSLSRAFREVVTHLQVGTLHRSLFSGTKSLLHSIRPI